MHALNRTRRQIWARHGAPVVAIILSLCFTWASALITNTYHTPGLNRGTLGAPQAIPRAAAVWQDYTYPMNGGQLWQNATHNLTAGLRDDAAWGRTYDGGYLSVNKSGTQYSNTSLVPSGTFNATYSFTNDTVGSPAGDWTSSGGLSTSVLTANAYSGHSKVLQVYDANATSNVVTTQMFSSSQTKGSIDFWILDTIATSNGPLFAIQDISDYLLVYIYVTGGNFVFSHAVATFIAPHIANRWYHWTLEFDSSTDIANVTLDGFRILTNEAFSQVAGDAVKFRAGSGQQTSNIFSTYLDAVDYSWSPGWSANRSLFDLSPLGYYNATHTFDATPPFTVPAGWANTSGTNCSAYVAPANPTLGGHKTVMVLDDGSVSTAANATVTAPAAITSGSIEYWVATADVTSVSTCGYLFDAGETGFATYLYFSGGNLYSWSGGAAQLVQSVSANMWYHIRVEVDCTNHLYSIWVDNVLRQLGVAFQTNIASVHHLQFNTSIAGSGYVLCVDALDFSTDPAYAYRRSSFVILQQNNRFSELGSYTFRFTLNASGVDYPGVWTTFDVVAWSGPENLVASGAIYRIDLAWDPFTATGGNPVTGYKVYRGATSGAEAFLATIGNVTIYSDQGLTARVPYYYTITALSTLGETPFSAEASALPVTEPLAPQSLLATPGNHSVNLTWAAPADTGGTWVINYVVYQSMISGMETFLASVGNTTLTYNDTPLSNGLPVYYQVSANNSVGEGPRTGEVFMTPCTTPSAPLDLAITAGDGYLQLIWVPPASDGGVAITGYTIYRGAASGALSLLQSISPVSSYKDTAVSNGVKYYYVISANNNAGEGQNSTEASGFPTKPLQLGTTLNDDGVLLEWNSLPYVVIYKVYRVTDAHFDYRLWEPITTTGATSYQDNINAADGSYYYQVVGCTAGGDVIVASEVKAAYTPGGSTPLNPLVFIGPAVAGAIIVVAYVVYWAKHRVPHLRRRGL